MVYGIFRLRFFALCPRLLPFKSVIFLCCQSVLQRTIETKTHINTFTVQTEMIIDAALVFQSLKIISIIKLEVLHTLIYIPPVLILCELMKLTSEC